jgi:hypothetical protein
MYGISCRSAMENLKIKYLFNKIKD